VPDEGPRQFTDPSAPRHHERHVRTPTGELDHQEKLARQRLHITILSVVLVLALLMLAYASIFDLNSWAEWVVLGAICFTAIGALVAVNTRAN
jgi:multidrug efflux pump subunit AcrB